MRASSPPERELALGLACLCSCTDDGRAWIDGHNARIEQAVRSGQVLTHTFLPYLDVIRDPLSFWHAHEAEAVPLPAPGTLLSSDSLYRLDVSVVNAM